MRSRTVLTVLSMHLAVAKPTQFSFLSGFRSGGPVPRATIRRRCGVGGAAQLASSGSRKCSKVPKSMTGPCLTSEHLMAACVWQINAGK